MIRHGEKRKTRQITEARPGEKRTSGRLRKTYMDGIKERNEIGVTKKGRIQAKRRSWKIRMKTVLIL